MRHDLHNRHDPTVGEVFERFRCNSPTHPVVLPCLGLLFENISDLLFFVLVMANKKVLSSACWRFGENMFLVADN